MASGGKLTVVVNGSVTNLSCTDARYNGTPPPAAVFFGIGCGPYGIGLGQIAASGQVNFECSVSKRNGPI